MEGEDALGALGCRRAAERVPLGRGLLDWEAGEAPSTRCSRTCGAGACDSRGRAMTWMGDGKGEAASGESIVDAGQRPLPSGLWQEEH